MHPAMYFEQTENQRVVCRLCPHHCQIAPGRKGICRVRENRSGCLYSLNYGKISSWGLDPIEKKPLYHFYPGSYIFSAGTVGCNFRCEFCQNWEIAQGDPPLVDTSPKELVAAAAGDQRSVGLAYTYSEPMMWYEFVLACARLARDQGLKNVLVTNGFIEPGPLAELLPVIDAFNIDIKGFTADFYRRVIKGRYEPVLDTAVAAKRYGCHIELTTLLIPGLNDSGEELEKLTDWVAEALGADTPLHFSRYFPNYKMKLEPTPIAALQAAYRLAARKLHYVYLGNLNLPGTADTYCPECGYRVIERNGYTVKKQGLSGSACANCGHRLAIVTSNETMDS